MTVVQDQEPFYPLGPPNFEIIEESITATRNGDTDIYTFSDTYGDEYRIEAVYNAHDQLVTTRQFKNGWRIDDTYTFWSGGEVSEHRIESPEGYWTRTDDETEPIEAGGGGGGGGWCDPGHPDCMVQIESDGCGEQWWDFAKDSGHLVGSTVWVAASLRPPKLNPSKASLAVWTAAYADWGTSKYRLGRCLNEDDDKDKDVDPM